MVKKEKIESFEVDEVIEPSENIPSDNEFDLSVLKKDLENAEKEAKEAVNRKLIEQANIQQDTENIQQDTENIQQETENIQTVNEALKEILEFGFSFVNRRFRKVDVSSFDNKFIDELIEKLMKLIPKDQVKNFHKVIGLTDKTNLSIQLLKIGKFIMFISQELMDRYDEYIVYRDINEMPKLKFQLHKKDKTEV